MNVSREDRTYTTKKKTRWRKLKAPRMMGTSEHGNSIAGPTEKMNENVLTAEIWISYKDCEIEEDWSVVEETEEKIVNAESTKVIKRNVQTEVR